ncbi:DUF5445 family protein [Escherichia coli]|uniref:DUF5445 family protein n=1 Tax=Escherichia coli TaxID=562 RepID=UPI003D901981
MLCFLIYITLPFIQLVYFISSEKKLTIHIVQMFHLLSQVFYNLKKFLMMDMLGVDWPPESPDNQYHLNK